MKRLLLLLTFVLGLAWPSFAQTPAPSGSDAEPPLRRWLEIQNFTVYSRYRFAENNKPATTSDQLQYKDTFRARINLDAEKRFTINFGYFSGSNFISTWNNWGVGNGTTFDGANEYLKQLYASAIPVKGLEIQYGGLYLNRGEADEFLTYDDDGYITGERVSVRRPKELWLDEITVTRAQLGPAPTPNVLSRWDGLKNPDYTQVLGLKKFNKMVSGSLEYNRQAGADLMRTALTLRFDKGAPLSTIRYEQYYRSTGPAVSATVAGVASGGGFGLWADRPITKYFRAQGGYVSVDANYGGWNADRMQAGRRVFFIGTIPIYGPLAASVYATHAFTETFSVSVNRRYDAVISYDVLDTLRRTRIF